MAIRDKALVLSTKFKLDSHHAVERFGVFFGIFVVTGVLVLGSSGAAAYKADADSLTAKAQYTQRFETSKTQLGGQVDGVYVDKAGTKALVMMHFENKAKISYNAADYRAFLLGSDTSLKSEKVTTAGIVGAFHVFGSTGYVGVLIESREPFERQVLNLTVRANAELSFAKETADGKRPDGLADDATFAKYDQWRVFFNPGGSEAKKLAALESDTFDPAQAYYEIALKKPEVDARAALDSKLVEMRTDLNQISSYTGDLATTKVDGLFLRPPTVPASIAHDRIEGNTATESGKTSTLSLKTKYVVPTGLDVNWRAGNIYDGYLDALVPPGQSYAQWLMKKSQEKGDDTLSQLSNTKWMLSDGTSLVEDYRASDVAMQPLISVMNNLSQAYSSYAKHKSEYQSGLTLDLISLEVELRNVKTNSSVSSGKDTLVTLY